MPPRRVLLTQRQLEIVRLLIKGRHNREIAAELGISENTVKFHFAAIQKKFRARSRTDIAVMAVRQGIDKVAD